VDYFVFRAAKEMGALAAVLGGIEGLVFTAGIGENSAEIRRRLCEAAAWLGVKLDAAANQSGKARISTEGSRVSVWVIPTNEELMIAPLPHSCISIRLQAGFTAEPRLPVGLKGGAPEANFWGSRSRSPLSSAAPP
jgi:acetate kinase